MTSSPPPRLWRGTGKASLDLRARRGLPMLDGAILILKKTPRGGPGGVNGGHVAVTAFVLLFAERTSLRRDQDADSLLLTGSPVMYPTAAPKRLS